MKKTVITFIGTRPEIIKMSTLLPKLDVVFNHIVIYSGQHYSRNLESIFFEELKLRFPDHVFEISKLDSLTQVTEMMKQLNNLLNKYSPDAVIVHGDTNTAFAGAITVKKWNEKIKLIHVESGGRSFNIKQPEELNRVMIDRLSDLLLASNQVDYNNLIKENIDSSKVKNNCNTIIDCCFKALSLVDSNLQLLDTLDLVEKKFLLSTFHRQESVDNKQKLTRLVRSINEIAKYYKVVIPLHPRTKIRVEEFRLSFDHNVKIIDPIGYLDLLTLLKKSRFCLTDSGGLQEEAMVAKIPALILREETELMQYVDSGFHSLVGTSFEKITKHALELIENDDAYNKRLNILIKYSKNTTNKIMNYIEEKVNEKTLVHNT
eukprot:COSAG01_NODE_755_length_13819_cov_130.671939_2_plen_375_part_00